MYTFLWRAIQPNGPRSWNAGYFPDQLLRREIDSGRRIAGLLIGTPSWAGDGGPTSPPRGLELPIDDPGNSWAAFVRSMAERYRGRIDHWLIWNEPDIWDPRSPLYTWSGSDEQFYRLHKVAYLAIKRGNPDAKVGLPGLTYWWDAAHQRDQFFERFLRIAERNPEARVNDWFFDAAVLHLYNDPRGLFQVPTLFRERMAARGISRPIWINETNVTVCDDPANPLPRTDFRASLEEQAGYVIQATAWALVSGVEHLAIYPFVDGDVPPGEEQMGLIRRDGSPRPALRALQTVTRYLMGVEQARLACDDDVVSIILRRYGETITVLWSAAPRSLEVTVPATAERAVLVDKYGAERPLMPTDAVYRLSLRPATHNTVPNEPGRYLVGGDPLILVERDAE